MIERVLVMTALLFAVASSEAASETVSLTLKEAMKLAIERNLELRTEVYNTAIARADIRKNRGIYNTLLGLNVNYVDSTTYPAIIGATGMQRVLRINPTITQLLPTGGTVGIQYNNARTETDYAFSIYPDYWQSEVSLAVSQPLLRNFGSDVTNLNIIIAEQAGDAALRRLAAKIQKVVAQVRTEYFKLNSFREDHLSKKVSLELARRILNDISERVKAGVLPAMEVLNAEYGVALRERELIDAEKALRDQVDLLQQILQMPPSADIVAVDEPNLEKVFPDVNDAVRKALTLRPEMDEAKIQITSAEAQRKAARNRTLPSLNLVGNFALTGFDEDYARNLDRLSSQDYLVWSVGVQFEYPLGNDSAQAEYEKTGLRVDQTKNQLAELSSTIATDVRAAVRSINSSYKQLDVAARGRAFAEERLKAYSSRAQVGLATTKDLLDVENDLATARSNQIKAQVTYMISVTQFMQATGQLLEQEKITVNGTSIDQLLRRK